jgi:hypothetical protein
VAREECRHEYKEQHKAGHEGEGEHPRNSWEELLKLMCTRRSHHRSWPPWACDGGEISQNFSRGLTTAGFLQAKYFVLGGGIRSARLDIDGGVPDGGIDFLHAADAFILATPIPL